MQSSCCVINKNEITGLHPCFSFCCIIVLRTPFVLFSLCIFRSYLPLHNDATTLCILSRS
uniref:Uncharacterized protein n=1 Tax=Arundo donax TaxID=35708 RepID=A0A0A9CE50_ARUDO